MKEKIGRLQDVGDRELMQRRLLEISYEVNKKATLKEFRQQN